jgi:hypothetical protein
MNGSSASTTATSTSSRLATYRLAVCEPQHGTAAQLAGETGGDRRLPGTGRHCVQGDEQRHAAIQQHDGMSVMADAVEEIEGTRVLVVEADGPAVRSGQDLLELLGAAYFDSPAWIAVPVGRLPDEFFDLGTGIAGEIVQKCANYRVGFAVLGDISRFTAASTALTALVAESNRGRQTWFLTDLAELEERLSGS